MNDMPRNPEIEAIVNHAFDPKNAAIVLMEVLRRPHMRGNGKSSQTLRLDMALCRAIVSLEKEKPNDTKTRNIADATVYTDFKHEAWVAALNILATEFYVKTNQPEKYTYYCEQLAKLDDNDLECLHIWLSLNRHITSLGHMMSHGDYEQAKDNLFDFLEEHTNDQA
jgi:hypothetical protein